MFYAKVVFIKKGTTEWPIIVMNGKRKKLHLPQILANNLVTSDRAVELNIWTEAKGGCIFQKEYTYVSEAKKINRWFLIIGKLELPVCKYAYLSLDCLIFLNWISTFFVVSAFGICVYTVWVWRVGSFKYMTFVVWVLHFTFWRMVAYCSCSFWFFLNAPTFFMVRTNIGPRGKHRPWDFWQVACALRL